MARFSVFLSDQKTGLYGNISDHLHCEDYYKNKI